VFGVVTAANRSPRVGAARCLDVDHGGYQMIITIREWMVMSNGGNDQRFGFSVTKPELPQIRVKTFRRGRTCSEPGCHTKLSIYNSHGECWQHESARPYYLRADHRSKTTAA
jgi:hypothetical protein